MRSIQYLKVFKRDLETDPLLFLISLCFYYLKLRTEHRFTKFFEFQIGHLIGLQNELIFQCKVV